MPSPILPLSYPVRLSRESVRGGGGEEEEEEEEVDRDHVSVPSVPPFPQRCTNVQWDWAILVFNPDLQN